MSHPAARGQETKMEKRRPDIANEFFGGCPDTQNKSEGGLGKSDWMNLIFLIKSEVESPAGSKVFPWLTLGRTGGSRIGTGESEKVHHLPSIMFYLCVSLLLVMASTALVRK